MPGANPSQNRQRRRRRRRHPLAPSVWPAWLLVGCAWLLTALPGRWQPALGRGLGTLAYHCARSRRRIAYININHCFPELNEAEQRTLVRATFMELGIGLMEILQAWLHPRRLPTGRIAVLGRERFDTALAQGRGVILLGGHFAVMDLIAPVLADLGPIDLMYRRNKNPAWEWLQVRGRRHFFERVIERDDTRAVLRSLRAGRAVWYAPDQDYGRKHSVFAPFFGVPAATITATARLARLTGAPVLLLSQHRDPVAGSWTLRFSETLADFPGSDEVVNATRVNALLESAIRRSPAQYLWIHKRFKTRPSGEPPFYPRRSR